VILEGVYAGPHDARLAQVAEVARFVCMRGSIVAFPKDWCEGAYAGIDFWSRAEELVTKRRNGELSGRPPSHSDLTVL